MRPLRALLFGLAAAAGALVASVMLLTNIAQKVVYDQSVQPVRPGTVLSGGEMDLRTRKAEAELAASRAQVQSVGFANPFRADLSSYFAILSPFALLALARVCRSRRLPEVVAFLSPALLVMVLLGVHIFGLPLLSLVVLVLLVLSRKSIPTRASDA
jgi:hypothetical protein